MALTWTTKSLTLLNLKTQARSVYQESRAGLFTYKPARRADVENLKSRIGQASVASSPMLPLWVFDIQSPRDNSNYTGVMVGKDPFNGGTVSTVPTYVVPIIVQTNTIGASFNSKTGIISTSPGATRFDPTAPDFGCLAAPNNIALRLFEQSPILNTARFDFGGTPIGDTQYVDAFQRANFWQAIGGTALSDYHVLLTPHTLPPIFINVPAQYGTTLPQADFPACGPTAIIDINWFDTYVTNRVLPALKSAGVNPSSFPILFVNNVVWAFAPTNLGECCILGYHGTTSFPIQTYSPADFDTTGLFGAGEKDTAVLSHEVSEWMNDPFGNNATPAWGGTGQVVGACQNNLEVGDPLSGSNAPRIYMPNGYTYHLQELAFFSWFFGAPSIGVNDWYSNNGTFLTDAGPVCVSSSAGISKQVANASELAIAPIR